jgi:hypothetical protein
MVYIYTTTLERFRYNFNITSTGQFTVVVQRICDDKYHFNYQSTAISISGANSSITLATSGTQTITGGPVITNTSNAQL